MVLVWISVPFSTWSSTVTWLIFLKNPSFAARIAPREYAVLFAALKRTT